MAPASPITDPASVLIGLGALVAMVAGVCWYRVFRDLERDSKHFPARSLSPAALVTAAALWLVGLGYLLGRFTGRF